MCKNTEKMELLKKAQHNKTENVAGSVWLSLFMDGSGKCKLPSMSPNTDWSRIDHLKRIIANFEFETSADKNSIYTNVIVSVSWITWDKSAQRED